VNGDSLRSCDCACSPAWLKVRLEPNWELFLTSRLAFREVLGELWRSQWGQTGYFIKIGLFQADIVNVVVAEALGSSGDFCCCSDWCSEGGGGGLLHLRIGTEVHVKTESSSCCFMQVASCTKICLAVFKEN